MKVLNSLRILLALLAGATCMTSYADIAPPGGDTQPQNTNPCHAHLTRAADVIINMHANQQEYLVESEDAPGSSWAPNSTIIQSTFNACKRRIIEIRVPSTTSSGCANCYSFAEIHACAGYFPGSKSFEEICRVPTSGTPEATCKTFNHKVDVYKKAAGTTAFNPLPVRSYVYKGYIENGVCRVAAQYLGQVHDTSEVYASVIPPASGTDVYRVLSYPVYEGNVLSTQLSVGFESMRE